MRQQIQCAEIHLFLNSNIPEVEFWFIARNMTPPPRWTYSDFGYIVPGTACGFLYLTNSGIAYLDTFVSNPDKPKKERIESIENIARKLINAARDEFVVKTICCTSDHLSIQRIAMSLGFKETGARASFSRGLNT